MNHIIDSRLLNKTIAVHVIGCGGTGTQVLSGLARLHVTLLELGHPGGLDVTVWDDDRVEAHNVGRQLFFPCDVGRFKSDVMVNRLNLAYGLQWKSRARRFDGAGYLSADLVIGCVDTKASRQLILSFVSQSRSCYWLDFGNSSGDGQVLLGNRSRNQDSALPLPTDLFPELVDGPEDTETPTCSVRASVARQGLFLNQMVATWGLELLFRLFTTGKLDWHGVFINTSTGSATKLKVDPAAWSRLGYAPGRGE